MWGPESEWGQVFQTDKQEEKRKGKTNNTQIRSFRRFKSFCQPPCPCSAPTRLVMFTALALVRYIS
jgi:hypothetical protein